MNFYSRALNDELSKFRKRKNISAYGATGGVQYNRFVKGLHAAGSRDRSARSGGHNPSSTYDPFRGSYDTSGPGYTLPPPWFEGMTQPPRSPRSEARFGDRMRPMIPQDDPEEDDGVMTGRLMDRFIEELEDLVFAEGLGERGLAAGNPYDLPAGEASPPDPTTDPTPDADDGPSSEAPPAGHPWFGAAEMTQEMFDQAMRQANGAGMAPQALDGQPYPFSMAETAYDQQIGQSLEAIVEQDPMAAMANPEAVYDPLEEDPFMLQQLLYDQQMMQLMNPFMMPGPGPG